MRQKHKTYVLSLKLHNQIFQSETKLKTTWDSLSSEHESQHSYIEITN